MERRFTRDHSRHDLLDRPRDHPTRTAIGEPDHDRRTRGRDAIFVCIQGGHGGYPVWYQMESQAATRAAMAGQRASDQAKRSVRRRSAILKRAARALDQSAAMAEQHAQRRERVGDPDEAAEERAAAFRSAQAAKRARTRAEELDDL
ncbi:MAG TPA: hypothetical protein VHV28_06470 [Solirubrobacteraceae bacterium]|nr:hypothetical protein [Solirubrobacteraceae bacterium]